MVHRAVLVAVLKDIVLIPVHTAPWDSERELDELYEVFLVVKDKWKTDVSCVILLLFSIMASPESSITTHTYILLIYLLFYDL